MCFLTKLTEFVKVNHPCINAFTPTTFSFPTPSDPPTTWPIEKTDNGFTYLFTRLRHVGSGKRDWPSCSNIHLVSRSLINCQKTIEWSFRSRVSHLPPLFCSSWHSKLEKKVSKAVSLVICTRPEVIRLHTLENGNDLKLMIRLSDQEIDSTALFLQ